MNGEDLEPDEPDAGILFAVCITIGAGIVLGLLGWLVYVVVF